jgi:SAM-dependent methyltransferase
MSGKTVLKSLKMRLKPKKTSFRAKLRNLTTSTPALQKSDDTLREDVHQMREMMKGKASSSHQGKNPWDELWKNGTTPWDLGMATPVLSEELKNLNSTTSFYSQNKMKPSTMEKSDDDVLSVLVPGCGSGYDLHTIARYLQQVSLNEKNDEGRLRRSPTVTGLDISPTSLAQARDRICSLINDEDNSKNNGEQGNSKIHLKLGDFFSPTKDWRLHATINYNSENDAIVMERNQEEYYDFIYDYTFFCALDPKLRGNWAERMSTLLKPKTGRLLTLIFPFLEGVDTSGPLRGPPFPVTVQDYKRVLEPLGFEAVEGPYVSEHTVESRKGQEYICWWTFDGSIRSSL